MKQTGFVSLINLTITVLVLAVIITAAFVWIDPIERIGTAKDKRRAQDIAILKNALGKYVNDNYGALPVLGEIGTSKKVICSIQSGSDLTCDGEAGLCLKIDDNDFLAKYISAIPVDPDKDSAADSGYFLKKDANNKLVVGACSQYGSSPVVATTTIQVSCGAYGGGHCWYLSGENQTCDAYCSSLNKECVDYISYGQEDGDSSCVLNLAFGDCNSGSSCDAQGSNNNPPKVLDDISECYYQANPIACNIASGMMYFNICPCR